MLRTVTATLIFAVAPTMVSAQSLEGVWRLVGYELDAGSGRVTAPAYTAYANGHFTIMWVTTDFPNAPAQRPAYDANSGPEDLVAAWGPLVAQFGSYVVNGSTITYTQLVSKNPSAMLPANRTYSRDFRVTGNMLETRGGDPVAVYRYERVR